MENVVIVRKFKEDGRKVIHLINRNEFVFGSYVDNELMNVNVFNIVLDCIERGYIIKVEDKW